MLEVTTSSEYFSVPWARCVGDDMARSRRRSASRSSSSRAASGWLNLATLLKIGGVCLVGGAGTYGVFYAVSNMPAGAQNITEGVEVGSFEASAIAMSQKPPLPDDTAGIRFASSAGTMPAATNPANPANKLPAAADNPDSAPIKNVFATDSTEKPKSPSLPSALPSPGGINSSSIAKSPSTPPALGGLPSPAGSGASNPNATNPSDLKPAPLPGLGAPKTNLTAEAKAPALLGDRSASPPSNPIANNTAAKAPSASDSTKPDSSDALLNTLRSTASNNAPKLPSALSPDNGLNNPNNSLQNTLPQNALPQNTLAQNNPAQTGNPAGGPPNPLLNTINTKSAADTTPATSGLPALPRNNALAGITNPTTPSNPLPSANNPQVGNRSNTLPNNSLLNQSSGVPDLPRGLPNGLTASNPERRSASPLGAAALPGIPTAGNNSTNPNPPVNNVANNGLPGSNPLLNNSAGNPAGNRSGISNPTASNPANSLGSSAGVTSNPLMNRSGNLPPSATPNVRIPNDPQVRPVGYPENTSAPVARPASSLVSNQPGEPQWEIQQNAAIVLEKRAPEQVQVNVPATFVLVVRNVGRVPASQVLIRDRIPKGARLVQASPQPTRQEGDRLEWDLATLPPGETVQITTELIPTQPGELGSVAEVSLAAVAACRTRCTQPKLVIEHSAPPQILVGQQVVMNITVRNDGDGPAENVTIRETVPSGLRHQSGNEIENPIGRLLPGQSRNIQLPLLATQAGQVQNTVRVTGDGKLSDEHTVALQIVAPSLQVNMDGPTRRYLSREAVHQMSVKNNGTANATNVQMMAQLPRGLKYQSSSPAGRYDPNRHAVFWAIQQLPSQQSEQLSITTLPLAPGEQVIKFQALADLNQPQEANHKLVVEQLSELFFEVDDVDDPIEINSNTTYVVRLENQGSQVANDVAMIVDLPQGIEPLRVDGTVQYDIQNSPTGGKRIVFAPIAVLNPGAKLATQIQVRGTREGDHKIEVQLTSAQRTAAVAKQEITKVYSDLR